MKNYLFCCAALFLGFSAAAQKDPEFPVGWVLYVESHYGMATHFTASPDLFIGGLRVSPQATVIPGRLRLGTTADAIFSNKKFYGTFGPNLVVKLGSVNLQQVGSLLNVQLQGEHLWGTGHQKLLGGLLQAELGQILLVGFSFHRDYGLGEWWFQGGIGYNLLHKRKKGLEDPMQ